MALPTTGPLSLNDIRVEIGAATTNVSLGAMSDTAGFSAPDAITDFYGFSSGLNVIYITALTSRNSTGMCGTGTSVTAFYHDGASAMPIVGDIIYSNSSGTTALTWVGYRGISNVQGGNAFNTYRVYSGFGGDDGEVFSRDVCP